MNTPGSDWLDIALDVIDTQTMQYFQNTGRTKNATGLYAPNFADPVNLEGSFQPLQRHLYRDLGLDFNKTYYVLYVSSNLIDIQRDVSGDEIVYQGSRFKCENAQPWYGVDGWTQMQCVRIGNA